MKTVRCFVVLIALGFAIFDIEAGDVGHKGICTTKDNCLANKNLDCRMPFPDCKKGYCLCSDDAVEWESDGCVLEYRTNGASCDTKLGHMCLGVAGLTCSSGKCTCPNGENWDGEVQVCTDSTVKVVKAAIQTCGASRKCRGKSGKVTVCAKDDSKCQCDTGYTFKNGGCVKTSNYEGECAKSTECTTKYKLLIEGSTEKDVVTSFECINEQCSCKATNPTYVSMLLAQGFCKESGGKIPLKGACTNSKDCSGTMACGKCPDDTTATCKEDKTKKVGGICKDVEECPTGAELKCLKPFPGCEKGYCLCNSTLEWKKAYNKCKPKVVGKAGGSCDEATPCEKLLKLPVDGLNPTDVNTNLVCLKSKCSCDASQTLVKFLNTDSQLCKAQGNKLFLEPCANSSECSDKMVCGYCPEDKGENRCQKDTEGTYKSPYLGACRANDDCQIGECTNPSLPYGVCACPVKKPLYLDKECKEDKGTCSGFQIMRLSDVLAFFMLGVVQVMSL